MTDVRLKPIAKGLNGSITVPGDKSVSHRSIIFGALAKGKTTVRHFLTGEDCLRTIDAFRALGVAIEQDGDTVIIDSAGKDSFKEPTVPIYFGNSGTTARLLLGVFAALPFHITAYGDASLTKRPMDRVVIPLRQMGAKINGREQGKYLPLAIDGQKLSALTYHTPVKSAQVKSALLLAGLLADGETRISEDVKTRDHTEQMLESFGAIIDVAGTTVTVQGGQQLVGTDVYVPGDISSAAFFLVAACLVPGSEIVLTNTGLNDTRTGILDVLKQMGADMEIKEHDIKAGERIGDITIRYRPLKGTEIGGDIIPRLIDELPILALLATQADGETIIKDAEELRYKETDRIEAIAATLRNFGAEVESTPDGMRIPGNQSLNGATADSFGDHRIGMMIAIASLIAKGETILSDADSINISYPTFFEDLRALQD
ncbi:3-phosphoshikimate 1-carboxyvinyltransferase [Terribacillus saccharophilus]|uniref:3-phosphoshikimate 1-carboxyvinyltransferase n=1 Tax=Terribacillus saccharophilus TaxID=361277 RepID=UPI000BA56ECE|nr:3-phosphoshikimate 1-carboxyvinyltransferase [Terribacillus saccharophilus]PAF22682.1 3-phosphoshikimate 1-carboxyvinyltransferase [Terribacillus saccharophilus]